MSILGLQRRLAETGRIRIGSQVPTGNGDKKRPARLETFRLTSGNKSAIDAASLVYGGTPQVWEGSPAGKQWELFTEVDAISVLLPPEQMSFSQFYEIWSGGGCLLRCDGEKLIPSGNPCQCDPDEEGGRKCKPHTRLSVMLADLEGAGLWRLDTQGWNAAEELAGAFGMARLISQASGRSIVPATLRLDQREKKVPNEPVKRFTVPVLEMAVNLVALSGAQAETPALEQPRSPVTPVPQVEGPSLKEQIEQVGQTPRPTRANSAEPLRPTGVPVRPLRVQVEDDDILPPGAMANPQPTEQGSLVSFAIPEEEQRATQRPPAAPREAQGPAKKQEGSSGPPPLPEARGKEFVSQPQMRLLHRRLREAGVASDDRHGYLSTCLQMEVVSLADIRKDQMDQILACIDQSIEANGGIQGPMALKTGEEPFS